MSDPEKALGRSIGMPLMGELTVGEPDDVRELTDGAELRLAGLDFTVAHAPGHTKGSVTFRMPETADIPPVFFSGDLLFAGSIGRTDLPGGDHAEMLESLARVCLPLDDSTVVLSGHGPQTTIGRERATNPYPAGGGRRPGSRPERRSATRNVTRASVSTFKAPKGTYDLIPPDSAKYLAVREALSAPLRNSGYGYIETPGFEDVELFSRGVGESTDIVTKEMYTLTTKGGSELALRPEGTASVLRAALEANLHKAGNLPVKLWYSGSYYRYERPQKGRYRHFSQVGAEAIGAEDPALDAELIILADQAYRSLGLRNFRILLNSLGDKECRPVYRDALQELPARARPRRGDPPPHRHQPAAGARRQAPERAEAAGRRADAARLPVRRVQGVPRGGARAADRGGCGVRGRREAGPRPGLLHPHHLRVRPRRTRLAVRGGRRRPLRRPVRDDRRPGAAVGRLGARRGPYGAGAGGRGHRARTARRPPASSRCRWARRRGGVLFGVVTELRRAGVAADFAYGGKGLKGAMKSANRSRRALTDRRGRA